MLIQIHQLVTELQYIQQVNLIRIIEKSKYDNFWEIYSILIQIINYFKVFLRIITNISLINRQSLVTAIKKYSMLQIIEYTKQLNKFNSLYNDLHSLIKSVPLINIIMMKIDRKKYISSNQKINDQRQLKIKYQGLQFDDRIREKRTRYKNNHEILGDNVPNYSHLMNKTYHIDSSSQHPKTERLSISDNKKNYKNTSCSQKMHNCTIQKQYKNSQSFAKTQYLYQRTPRIIENQKKQMYLRRKNTINNMLKSFYVQKMEINPKRKSLNHLSRHTPDPTTSIRSNRQKPAELVNLSGLYSKHKSRTCNRPPKLKSKFHYKKDDSMMQIFSPGPSPWKIDSSPLL